MLLLITPVIAANYTVQYSPNNLTWFDVGFINQTTCSGRQEFLEQGHRYYLRVRTENSSFVYANERTESLGQMELAILIGLFTITVLLVLGVIFLNEELKFFSLLGAILSVVFNLNVAAELAADNDLSQVVVDNLFFAYKISLYILLFFVLYAIYKVIQGWRINKGNTSLQHDTPLERELR